MKLHSRMEVQGKLLVVTLSGELSFNAAWHRLKQTVDAALVNRVNFILIDTLAVEGKFTTVERYRLGTTTENYLHLQEIHPRIAIVGKPPASDGFAVLVAKNRSVIVNMFSSRREAINWLSSDVKKPSSY